MNPREIYVFAERVRKEIAKIIVGKEHVVDRLLVALLVNGHVLLEGVPGVAKTYLARSFADTLGLSFKRVQLTPDLLPSDILGVKVYNYKTMEFEFRPGPIFTNILLADEINRTPPRTQAALLEAMQERQVTVDGETKKLPEPFMVIATQNPIETEGTYPLPEAQLDRFLFRLIVSYPSRDEEIEMLRIKRIKGEAIDVEKIIDASTVLQASKAIAEKVRVDDSILEYIVDLVRATREHPSVLLGGSPRAEVMLLYAARAYAAISEGRDYVIPDDVKAVFFDVMNHRIILRPEYVIGTYSREPLWSYNAVKGIVNSVLEKVKVPK